MSNTQTDDYSEDAEQTPNWRRQLEDRARKAEARAQELESKLTTFERQSVFREAGLDPSNKQHAYFMKGYDGELSADAVRNDALEAGFLSASPSESAAPDELSAFARMDRASVDAPPVAPTGTTEEAMGKIMTASSEAEFYAAIKAAGMDVQG